MVTKMCWVWWLNIFYYVILFLSFLFNFCRYCMYLLLLLSSYSIPVASSTLVVVDLCCTAIVSHSVTVTVMLKRQRHSGSLFSCFTDSPECPQCFTGYEPRFLEWISIYNFDFLTILPVLSLCGTSVLFSTQQYTWRNNLGVLVAKIWEILALWFGPS